MHLRHAARRLAAPIATLLACANGPAADDLPIAPLPPASYGDWKADGTAFAQGPARGDLQPRLEIENAAEEPVFSSEIDGDQPTGTLTSPPFTISRPYLSFRIGGGDYERDTCVNLLVNGQVVKSAVGWRSDRLFPASWDVRAFSGQTAQIQIVDRASGDWGHVNVARLSQTDHPERLPDNLEPLYHEALRPQFHFTARQWTMDRRNPGMHHEGWINDLNGLIYYDGEYHLFAQRWATCWLHAVSRDLLHWTELPPAFWEESQGVGVQSGTCVIDYHNTSGLAADPAQPAMVAFCTRFDNRSHLLHYSLDHGRTWKFYDKNPVLVFPERDPKVFWYEPGHHWVMFMYGSGQYHIFTSPNLLDWHDEKNPIAQSFECPDFFQLPVDGDAAQKKWVLIQGDGKYSIGAFDGKKFTPESPRQASDPGDFYATQTWNNTDTGDGRRIQVAWMRFSHFPDMPFNQQITFPCELTLHATAQGLRVFRQPIREIERLHHGEDAWTNRTLAAGQTLPLEPSGRWYRLRATVRIPDGAKLVFTIRGIPIVLTSQSVQCAGTTAATLSPLQTVEILADTCSLETFANHGEASLTKFVLPQENGLSVKAEGAPVTIDSLVVNPLASAWPDLAPAVAAGGSAK